MAARVPEPRAPAGQRQPRAERAPEPGARRGEVEQVLAETGLGPERLVFEITESGVMRNPEVALADDARAPRSSASRSRSTTSAPATRRSRTCASSRSTASRSRGRSSSACRTESWTRCSWRRSSRLATSLGLDVVAEGIESVAQCQAVAALGCTHGQGFYFGEPLAGIGVSTYLWAPTLPARAASRSSTSRRADCRPTASERPASA